FTLRIRSSTKNFRCFFLLFMWHCSLPEAGSFLWTTTWEREDRSHQMQSDCLFLKEQYELVRESRKVLFDYCRTISPSDLIKENSSFGRGGSIRNLLVHIANTYEFWIARCGLKADVAFTKYDSKENIDSIVDLFDSVDKFMYEFMKM